MNENSLAAFNSTMNCIKLIQNFDGTDTNQLPDLITQTENILPSFDVFDTNTKNILFGFIKNKFVGLCRPVIHRHGNMTEWESFKRVILKNFGEKETSDVLMDMLKLCRVESTIEEYYNKINEISNRVHNRILIHDDKTYTTLEVNRIALRVFRDNLPEPTKTLIFARNPNSVEDAYKIIEDARHQSYTLYGPIRRNNRYNKPNFRTNFSNDNRNVNEPVVTERSLDEANRFQQNNVEQQENSRTEGTPRVNNRRQGYQYQSNNSSTSNSARVSTNSRNVQSSEQSRRSFEPMDINQSSVNFQIEDQDEYHI